MEDIKEILKELDLYNLEKDNIYTLNYFFTEMIEDNFDNFDFFKEYEKEYYILKAFLIYYYFDFKDLKIENIDLLNEYLTNPYHSNFKFNEYSKKYNFFISNKKSPYDEKNWKIYNLINKK